MIVKQQSHAIAIVLKIAQPYYIESVTRQLTPPILSTSHCEFNDTRLCSHA